MINVDLTLSAFENQLTCLRRLREAGTIREGERKRYAEAILSQSSAFAELIVENGAPEGVRLATGLTERYNVYSSECAEAYERERTGYTG